MALLSKITSFSINRESCFAATGFMMVKNVLLLVNFLSMLAGLILIGGGAYIQSQNFEDVINLSGTIAAGSIIVGVFVVVISFLGCFGAANEKGMLLKTYFALLLLVVVLELGVGGAAYTKKDDLGGMIETTWRAGASLDSQGDFSSSAIYTIERSLKCCGLNNITDSPVPANCTDILSAKLNQPITDGCFNQLSITMNGDLNTIGATGIVMGIIEFIGLIFSAVLFNRIARRDFANQSLMNEGWRVNKSKIQHGYQNYQYA